MRRAVVIAAAALAAAALAPVAQAAPAEPVVPDRIRVEEGHKVFLVGHAVGVQIYRCDGVSWTFVGPRADLFDDRGNYLMAHFGGPSWETKDGSSVIGFRIDGVPVDGAIPWLKLGVSYASTTGRLADTKFIQRINTTGGVTPPAETCNADAAGQVREVPYTADYYFWKAKA